MISVNFHQLEIFYAVARRLSYSRAAEELYISQPAVSKRVQELEKALGTQLFYRQGRRISLTDAGRVVYDYAQKIFSLTDEVGRTLRELESLERGVLRLGASSTAGIYLLPSLLGVFKKEFPGVEIELDIANSQQVITRVLRSELNLGLISSTTVPPGLQWQPFGADELTLIVATEHPFAQQDEVSASALTGETLLLRERGSGTREWLERELERLDCRPKRVIEISNTEAIKRAAAANLGVAFVSRRAVKLELAQGLLALGVIRGLNPQRMLGIVSYKGRRLPPAALAFVALLHKTPLEE